MGVYNIEGANIADAPFFNNLIVDYGFFSGAQYYLLRIAKRKFDGTEQYPFVVAPNGLNKAELSALDLALLNDDYYIVINAGLGDATSDDRHIPMGQLIVDSQVVLNQPLNYRPLVIDGNGDLSAVPANSDAYDLVAGGAVSCLLGFGPIVIDYENVAEEDFPSHKWGQISQRQIIGQYANGDYAIVTCEGRDFDNSEGWDVPKMQAFCNSINLKFAYCLDGGGSTETVIGKKQLNIIYERTNGRRICSLIVFNGTDDYIAPVIA